MTTTTVMLMAALLLASLLATESYTVQRIRSNLKTNGGALDSFSSRPLRAEEAITEANPDESATADDDASGVANLPPVIQQIVDERTTFQLKVGKAMDTLKKDMPEILRRAPGTFYRTSHSVGSLLRSSTDYSIYHSNITVIDPSGVQLCGLDKYQSSIAFLQTFQKFWFRDSTIQFRMVYDFCRSSIRISWHAVLIPKVVGRPLHVDGISYYQLDTASGSITEHKIENLVINNKPVVPPYGILSVVQQDLLGGRPQKVPAGVLGVDNLAGQALQ